MTADLKRLLELATLAETTSSPPVMASSGTGVNTIQTVFTGAILEKVAEKGFDSQGRHYIDADALSTTFADSPEWLVLLSWDRLAAKHIRSQIKGYIDDGTGITTTDTSGTFISAFGASAF